jgi:hypothetical protein
MDDGTQGRDRGQVPVPTCGLSPHKVARIDPPHRSDGYARRVRKVPIENPTNALERMATGWCMRDPTFPASRICLLRQPTPMNIGIATTISRIGCRI